MTKLEIGTDINRLPPWFLNFLHKNDIFESSKSLDWETKLEIQLQRYSGKVIFEKQSIFIQFVTEEHLSLFLVTFS